MEIWDQDDSAQDDAREQPELHRLLRGIADDVVPVARGDFYPRVIKRAGVLRRRRRAVRAASVTAVLAAAIALGPTVAQQLGMRGGAAVAAPPAAVVDFASAYPAPVVAPTEDVPATVAVGAARPGNALSWGTRGVALPDEARGLAASYLVERGAGGVSGSSSASSAGSAPGSASSAGSAPGSASSAGSAPGSASVTTLWAGVEDDTTSVVGSRGVGGVNVNGSPERLIAQDAHKTWLFVMQGWTRATDGSATSPAVLLVGEYTAGAASTSMTVYETPVAFGHPRPGSGDDKNDTEQIAELSIWLPEKNQLLVLGAPQTKTVLYAKTGGDLIPQKTVDGVALFSRTRTLVKGRYADTVQVRDAKNVALTPPKAWAAGDFSLTGVGGRWVSSEPGWVAVVGAVAGAKGAAVPSGAPSGGPGTPSESSLPSPVPSTARGSAKGSSAAPVAKSPVGSGSSGSPGSPASSASPAR